MSENFELILTGLESKLNELNSKQNSLQGQCSLLSEQCIVSEHKIEELTTKKELYRKAVELLTVVEKSTKEVLKKGFESIINHALIYILNDDRYGFSLDFNRRGNLQEIDFNLITPECKEPHDIIGSNGGGTIDILSVALRVSMIELMKPSIEGFLILDEPYRHLSKNYTQNAIYFLKKINRKFKRQVIMTTHNSEIIDLADKSIEIK